METDTGTSDAISPSGSAGCKQGRFHFNETQKSALKTWFYDKGIRSVAKQYTSLIGQIASDIGVQQSQVKVRLCNYFNAAIAMSN